MPLLTRKHKIFDAMPRLDLPLRLILHVRHFSLSGYLNGASDTAFETDVLDMKKCMKSPECHSQARRPFDCLRPLFILIVYAHSDNTFTRLRRLPPSWTSTSDPDKASRPPSIHGHPLVPLRNRTSHSDL